MALWGKTTNSESRPKFLPVDSNASGSMGARENCIAQPGGWALSAGLASSGNDNTGAQPEILVCIRGLGTTTLQGANVMSIDWTDGAYADAANFDITVTFDEKVTVTSAALSANQTVTNKAYILLGRVGETDMTEDNTVACQYLSGTGTNQLVFRGVLQAARAGFLTFSGYGFTPVTGAAKTDHPAIVLNGTATIVEEGGDAITKIRQESGTSISGDAGDGILMNSTAGAVATVNGALSESATLVIDTVTGTLAVGQVITVKSASGTDITALGGETSISQDNTLTITAVASQTSVTLSEAITVANDVVLLASTNGGSDLLGESIDFSLEGFDGATDVPASTRTGEDEVVGFALEGGDGENDGDKLILNATDGSAANANEQLIVEDFSASQGLYTQISEATGIIALEDDTGDNIILDGGPDGANDVGSNLIQESGSLTTALVLTGVTTT